MILLVTIVASTETAWAFKNGGPYIAIRGTTSFLEAQEDLDFAPEDEEDPVFGVGAAVGMNFADFDFPLRLEVEYMYRDNLDFETTEGNQTLKRDISVQTVFANAYVDLYNSTNFIPYFTAGFGFALIDTEILDIDGFGNVIDEEDDEIEFSWNIGAGLAYRFSDSFFVDLGYRFSDLQEASPEGVDYRADLDAHELVLGLRFQF
jgi:opacity protein-like surface antigen